MPTLSFVDRQRLERSDARWRQQRHATAAHISGCRSSPMWTEAAARRDRWAETTSRSPSRSIRRRPRGTAPSPRSPCRSRRRAVSHRAARPQNEFRLIRLDETRHQMSSGSEGSISAVAWPAAAAARRPMIVSELTPQSRKTSRLSFGGDALGEIKARSREALRASASCRCDRHRPPATPRGAGSAEEVRRRRGPNRSSQLWTRSIHWRSSHPPHTMRPPSTPMICPVT